MTELLELPPGFKWGEPDIHKRPVVLRNNGETYCNGKDDYSACLTCWQNYEWLKDQEDVFCEREQYRLSRQQSSARYQSLIAKRFINKLKGDEID